MLQRFDAAAARDERRRDDRALARAAPATRWPTRASSSLREVATTAESFVGDGTTTATLLARAIAARGVLPARRRGRAPGSGLTAASTRAVAAVGDWIQARRRGRWRPSASVARVATHRRRATRASAHLVADALDARRPRRRGPGRGRPGLRDPARRPRGDALRQRPHGARRSRSDRLLGETAFERALHPARRRAHHTGAPARAACFGDRRGERAPLVDRSPTRSPATRSRCSSLNVEQRAAPGRGGQGPGVRPGPRGRPRGHRRAHRREVLGPGLGTRPSKRAGLDAARSRRAGRRDARTPRSSAGRGARRRSPMRAAEREIAPSWPTWSPTTSARSAASRLARLRGAVGACCASDSTPRPSRTRPATASRTPSQAGRAALTRRDRAGRRRDAAAGRRRDLGRRGSERRGAGRGDRRAGARGAAAPARGQRRHRSFARRRARPRRRRPVTASTSSATSSCDLVAAGIFDPAKLVRSTLEIATSMAGVCLMRRADRGRAAAPAPAPAPSRPWARPRALARRRPRPRPLPTPT